MSSAYYEMRRAESDVHAIYTIDRAMVIPSIVDWCRGEVLAIIAVRAQLLEPAD